MACTGLQMHAPRRGKCLLHAILHQPLMRGVVEIYQTVSGSRPAQTCLRLQTGLQSATLRRRHRSANPRLHR